MHVYKFNCIDPEHFYENPDHLQHPPVPIYEQVLSRHHHNNNIIMQLQDASCENSSLNEMINMSKCPAYEIIHKV